ncbi:response regulator [Neorhizobium sp. T786]|uniref:response regulator n=1 Tax=Pseudorhizobium xiangyangii TaxID=2883104 RepID=UPI001D000F2B|nr:response regulator [Neorhizobium xiangyangii]MCB5205237.1 response regulator [Neorhizobium xiangyangii]
MALIVIAEDEFLIAEVLTIMLEDAGHQVEAAGHGLAALSLVQEKRPDLVITDFMMPLMTGLELAKVMRADNELSSIPIILVSGAQAGVGRSHPEFFDAVLAKPYVESQILRAVDAALTGRDWR